jgi:hypothetical protein
MAGLAILRSTANAAPVAAGATGPNLLHLLGYSA